MVLSVRLKPDTTYGSSVWLKPDTTYGPAVVTPESSEMNAGYTDSGGKRERT